jgi:predicted CXXCH cytochrome family protein
MLASRPWFAPVLGAALWCALTGLAPAAGAKGAHLNAGDCSGCHVAGSEAGQGRTTRLIASQEALCVRCHERAVQMSHPTGVVPTRPPPAEYPLDWKGELTCSTCHIVHGSEPGLLRGTKHARAFCLACHDQSFFSRMKDAGTSLVLSGHLELGRGTIDVDPHSMHCLGCHADGYAGGAVSVSRNGVLRHSSGSAPHPIGRSYREASRRGGFHPEHRLAQNKVKLSDGKVSCISCHEAYKQEHGKLVAANVRSGLCLTCHAK